MQGVKNGVVKKAVSSRSTNYFFQTLPNTSSSTISAGSKKLSQSSRNLIDDDDNSETNRLPVANDPSGVYSILMTDLDMTLAKRKFVKVSSVGEVEVSPDRVEFCVQIQSRRPDKAQAKESIRKREEFIMLALKKFGVPPSGITSTLIVKKYKLENESDVDDDILEAKILRDVEKQLTARKGDDDQIRNPVLDIERTKVMKELYVVCSSVNTYMELFSIVNEKLDRQVNVSPPVIRITPATMQRQTQAAVKLAMDNAMMKATQVLLANKSLRATVGKLFYSVEDSFTVSDIAEYQNINSNTDFQTLGWKRNNKLLVCKLTSLFEVNTSRAKRVVI